MSKGKYVAYVYKYSTILKIVKHFSVKIPKNTPVFSLR